MDLISLVVPCFNEEIVIKMFYDRVKDVIEKMEQQYRLQFEIILVNDGSTDNTLDTIKELAMNDHIIKYISFSRNFGKEAGLYAGLKASNGKWIAVMDVDLQDPPEMLEDMYTKIISGKVDCVAARRISREGEPRIRSFFAKCFYKMINKLSNTVIVDGARDFRLMTRQMVDAILSLEEYNRFSKGIFSWVGFNTEWIDYYNVERAAGNTSWSFLGLLVYAVDGIIAFSTMPLTLVTILGLLFALMAFIMMFVVIIKTIVWGEPVAGYPSLICVIFLIAGVQTTCLGIVGQYLAKTYMEAKGRPIYIIKESNMIDL